MTSYRTWPATSGPSTSAGNDGVGTSLGVEFTVTSAANFTGWFFWQNDRSNDGVSFGLYQMSDSTTGTLLTSVSGLSLTTAPGWNRANPTAPVALTPGTHYRAVVWSSSNVTSGNGGLWYTLTANGFPTPPGDLINGPLLVYSPPNALNQLQGSFKEPAASLAVTDSAFNFANYWIDVEVTDGAAPASAAAAGTATLTLSATGTAAGTAAGPAAYIGTKPVIAVYRGTTPAVINTTSAPSPPPSGGPIAPNTVKGWQLTPTMIGLSPFGITGNSLTTYTGPNAVDEGTHLYRQKITTWLDLSAGNIILEQCLFQPATGAVNTGDFQVTTWGQRGNNGPVTITDCEYDGSLLSVFDQAWIGWFVGVANIIRCYIHHSGSGTNTYSSGEATYSDVLVENNYVHHLTSWGDPNGSGNHESAYTPRDFILGTNPNRKLTVRGNYLAGDGGNMAGTILTQPNADSINNLTIDGNYLVGDAGYQLYIDIDNNRFPGTTYSNLRITNNRINSSVGNAVFVRPGVPSFAQWSENYMYSAVGTDGKGAPINNPNP
jgi:hypothetical protein